MKDKLIIIPSEGDIFTRDIRVSIIEYINEFCREYKIHHTFRKSENNKAPDVIAREGNLIIKTLGDSEMVWVYLPVLVSDDQLKWLKEKQKDLKKYNTVGVFSYKKDSRKPDNLMSVIELINEAERKNKEFKGSE